MSERKGMALFAALLMIGLTTCANMAKGEISAAAFKDMLQSRILEVLDEWPVEDQYAVMFFIYPNEEYEYRGYSNIPEFKMLYKNESEMAQPLYLPAVIKPKRKYRKPFLPSVKVTKKKRQLQRQLPGSAFLIPEKHFRILELIAEETIRSR